MKLLLDTHVFLWLTTDNPVLADRQRDAFLAPDSELYFSIASYWEFCIKHALGKLQMGPDWQHLVDSELERNEVRWLPVEKHHCQRLLELPHHHRDPFDRMLVAQALCEQMVLVTTDRNIRRYPIEVL